MSEPRLLLWSTATSFRHQQGQEDVRGLTRQEHPGMRSHMIHTIPCHTYVQDVKAPSVATVVDNHMASAEATGCMHLRALRQTSANYLRAF